MYYQIIPAKIENKRHLNLFIHPRSEGMKQILQLNVMNPLISLILVFYDLRETEMPYTEAELGCWDKRIIQIPINRTMTYDDAIHYSNVVSCVGYNLIVFEN